MIREFLTLLPPPRESPFLLVHVEVLSENDFRGALDERDPGASAALLRRGNVKVGFRLGGGSSPSGAVVIMAGATQAQRQSLAWSRRIRIGQGQIYILGGIGGASILAWSLAVAERRDSDACLNLSILNRWCFVVCSCTGGLHGLSGVVSTPSKDMTEYRLRGDERGDDLKVEATSSRELPPPGER